MDPITIAIALALAGGLGQVGGKLLEKGVIEPALEPTTDKLKNWLQRPYKKAKDDKALQEAIQTAFRQIGLPEDEKGARQYLLNLGFDQLQAEDNAPLRQEFARAVLLLTSPDPGLIPASLLSALRWPDDRRQILADFLATLRRQLADHEDWAALIEYADREAVRVELGTIQVDLARAAGATEQAAAYLRDLLAGRGLDPAKSDAQALAEYRDHLLLTYSRISFLFIRPAGRPDRMHTEAELETVFVPLHVHDPEVEEQLRRQRQRTGRAEPKAEAEPGPNVTINEVLARYPVFLLKGLPGSGKTTLLRHLALCFARGLAAERLGWTGEPLLPILVPLRNFGRFLASHRAEYTNPAPLALSQFIEDYFVEQDLALPPGFFRQRLQEGRCLVLLDGLDEVADRNQRATVAQMVSAFIQSYARRGNRFGLASRPRGYDEVAVFLPRPILCTVQPLNPAERDELVTKLLAELETNPRLCAEETRRLLADIRAKEKVDDLSRIPLFCTTMTLVYKYRGTTLPERRVDVYQELVDLMLGFWDVHRVGREGVAASEELARLDGTGRAFRDDRHAVEAKRRALTDLADWMQREPLAEAPKAEAEAHLAAFFREREGAKPGEDAVWASNFFDVAHQRSGLFVETEPDTYAFSHQNFREYLAATALIEQLDSDMVQTVLAHAADSWWNEVILLAVAHPNLSSQRREFLLKEMLKSGHLLLAGRCAVDAGDRLTAPLLRQIQADLYARMTDAELPPADRHAAGEVLDALSWLPDDLHAWLACPGCAADGGDLLAMKYPVTNAQFERFILAEGYDDPAYWGGEKSKGWQYRVKYDWAEPRYWNDPRFGRERRGYPVVGVSWYEAAAYAAWLTELLHRARSEQGSERLAELRQPAQPPTLQPPASDLPVEDQALMADLLAAGTTTVRLPAEAEWENLAGGRADPERYPWDPPQGPATQDQAAGLARANVEEAGLEGTSPVAMYPLGASQPFGLIDLAGNVWEWTDSWYDKDQDWRALRGGSWYWELKRARCGSRNGNYPNYWGGYCGFRLVSPVVSVS